MAIVQLSQSTNKLYRDFFQVFRLTVVSEEAAAKTQKWVSGLETTDNIPIATLGPGGAELSCRYYISEELDIHVCY